MPVPILYVIDSFKNPHAGTEGQLYQLVQGIDRKNSLPSLDKCVRKSCRIGIAKSESSIPETDVS